eukprot:6315209-Alexandrium_andersonii.AAC.1
MPLVARAARLGIVPPPMGSCLRPRVRERRRGAESLQAGPPACGLHRQPPRGGSRSRPRRVLVGPRPRGAMSRE